MGKKGDLSDFECGMVVGIINSSLYELHRRGAWKDKNNNIACLMLSQTL